MSNAQLDGSFTITNISGNTSETQNLANIETLLSGVNLADDAVETVIDKAAGVFEFHGSQPFVAVMGISLAASDSIFTSPYESADEAPNIVLPDCISKEFTFDVWPEIIGKSYYDNGTKRYRAELKFDFTKEVDAYVKLCSKSQVKGVSNPKLCVFGIVSTQDNGTAISYNGWINFTHHSKPLSAGSFL